MVGLREHYTRSDITRLFWVLTFVFVCNTVRVVAELFDIDLLDEVDPFEIDTQAAHLFKHTPLGVDDVFEV